jgi:septal ring factor EnvC (AmiA/AmiB activator)
MDRFSAAGAERKAALSELPHALAAVRQGEGIYHNVLKAEIEREQGARTRMAVEVPGLSDQARNALDQLTELRGQDRERLQRALPREVKDEFAAVNAALDKRFGPLAFVNASDSSIKELARHVAPEQRETLDKLHAQLKTLQQSVHDDIAQRHQAQRLQKSINRGPTIGG